MTHLSAHFTLAEFVRSSTADECGIDNRPPPDIIAELTRTAEFMEDVRAALGGHVIVITSGYRCPAVNHRVRGSLTSQHCHGQAVDFVVPALGTPLEVCRQIVACDPPLPFDQLIYERGGWVHISRADQPRRMVLTIDTHGNVSPGIRS